jgi:hypothetical protein
MNVERAPTHIVGGGRRQERKHVPNHLWGACGAWQAPEVRVSSVSVMCDASSHLIAHVFRPFALRMLQGR